MPASLSHTGLLIGSDDSNFFIIIIITILHYPFPDTTRGLGWNDV
jgi:hypothetical protein